MTAPLPEGAIGHHNGVADLLEQARDAAGYTDPVYRRRVPADPTFPYYVVWGATPQPLSDPDADRLAGYGGEIYTPIQITVAGLSEDDVIGATARALQWLYRRRPVVAGRACGDIGYAGAGGRPTESPTKYQGLPVFFAPLLLDLASSPKPV